VTALRALLRLFSYVFHALFVFVASVMAVLTLVSGPQTINFYLLPWQGRALVYGLLALAGIGVLVLLLAVRGKMQMLYVLWSALVLGLVARYFFFTSYGFTPDTGEFTWAMIFVLAALLALLGARMKPAPNSR
jgi:hypothetical protein